MLGYKRWMKRVSVFVIVIMSVGFLMSMGAQAKDQIALVIEAGNPELTWAKTNLWFDFEKETGIHVNVIEIPQAKMHEKFLLEFIAGTGAYDVIDVNSTWMPEFASAGFLEPLDDYITPQEKAQYSESALADSSYNGVLYGIPFISHTMYLYYRTDLLKEAGIVPPKTWGDYLTAVQKLTQDVDGDGKTDIFGTVLEGKRYISCAAAFIDWFTRRGGRILDDKGKVVIDSPEVLDTANFMRDLLYKYEVVPPGSVNYDCVDVATLFVQGKLAMAHNWYFTGAMADNPKQSKVVGKWDVAQIPKTDKRGGYLGSFALCIPKGSRNKEAAWKLIDYFFDHYATIRKLLPAPVTNRKALAEIFDDPEVSERQKRIFRVYSEGASVAIPMPPVPQQTALMKILEVTISSIMNKIKTPEEALRIAAKEMKEALGQ